MMLSKEAGASEEKKKLERLLKQWLTYDSRFNKIDQDLALLKAEITVSKWMPGFLVAGMVSLLFKAFAT